MLENLRPSADWLSFTRECSVIALSRGKIQSDPNREPTTRLSPVLKI